MRKTISILLFFILTIFNPLFAQKDSIKIAEELFYNENFSMAIGFYKKMIKFDPTNPLIHYQLGFSYLHTYSKRDSSIQCFKNSLRYYKRKYRRELNKEELTFYLARAYRVNYVFDSAIIVLNGLQRKVKNKRFKKLIEKELLLAKNGEEIIQKPVDLLVLNLGMGINTEYTEHTPVFSGDESTLIFTSRRPLSEKSIKLYDNEYDENIFISYKDTTGWWSYPKSISNNINTPMHEATIGLSFDGTKLFIYKDEDNGSIFYTEIQNNDWIKPIKLGSSINTKYRETHATISVSGSILYFTSDRPGGYGGLDIYLSKKLSDGTWGEAINLGKAVNTEYDEEGPYIHPDGKTIYFSSKGHRGLGGYDIFKSQVNPFGTYTQAENMGFPINSVDDDIYYFPTPDGKRAYFSSLKGSGHGRSDIYLMAMPEAIETDISVMYGYLTVCEGELPDADIIITDNTSGKYYLASPKNGKFIFVTNKGNSYKVIIEVNQKIVFNDNIKIPEDAANVAFYKTIRLDPEVSCDEIANNNSDTLIDTNITISGKNNYVEIENILFPYASANEITENKDLDKLALYLKSNSEAVVEIRGYCDARGSARGNYKLGIERANVVKSYLLLQGVNEKQLIAVSYGEENPIANNRKTNGVWDIESQKFNRRVDFKMIEQGNESSLLIWVTDIPEKYKSKHYKINYKKSLTNNIETTY